MNEKKTVVYYTSTSFMDVILETIQCIKHEVNLHVVIEISPQNRQSTIIHVDSLEGLNAVETPERVLGPEQWSRFKPYFEGVASVQFVVHRHPRSLSMASIKTAWKLSRYLKKFKADIFHFDTTSQRALGLYPYLLSKKVVISLHDPVPHPGEHDWKEDMLVFLYYRMAKAFVFYSRHAGNEFRKHYKNIRVPVHVISLQPYSFTRYFMPAVKPEADCILFFGRLSYYKGIDILMGAIPAVLEKYPAEKFVVAGKPSFGYEVDTSGLKEKAGQVELITRYLSTEELVGLISRAKFIVCPYREATQSGVLMTSYALGKTVLASTVGSFPQYVQHGTNGLLADPEPSALAAGIMSMLDQDRYKLLEKNVDPAFDQQTGRKNAEVLLQAYLEASPAK